MILRVTLPHPSPASYPKEALGDHKLEPEVYHHPRGAREENGIHTPRVSSEEK